MSKLTLDGAFGIVDLGDKFVIVNDALEVIYTPQGALAFPNKESANMVMQALQMLSRVPVFNLSCYLVPLKKAKECDFGPTPVYSFSHLMSLEPPKGPQSSHLDPPAAFGPSGMPYPPLIDSMPLLTPSDHKYTAPNQDRTPKEKEWDFKLGLRLRGEDRE